MSKRRNLFEITLNNLVAKRALFILVQSPKSNVQSQVVFNFGHWTWDFRLTLKQYNQSRPAHLSANGRLAPLPAPVYFR